MVMWVEVAVGSYPCSDGFHFYCKQFFKIPNDRNIVLKQIEKGNEKNHQSRDVDLIAVPQNL